MRAKQALLFCALLPGCVLADDFDERVAVAPGGLLEVDVDLGEGLRPDPGALEISSHDADEIHVVSDATGWGASGVEIRVEPGERAVRVYGRVHGAFSWLFGGPRINLRIWVPRDFSLDLRTSSGPIRVENTRGRIRARAADGSLEVVAVEGPVRLRGSGEVRASEVVGDVDVKSSNGAIELSWITGSIDARTGGGAIDVAHCSGSIAVSSERGAIELREVDGPVEAKTERGGIFASFAGEPEGVLSTQRGGVQALLPAGVGARLDAVSRRGEVEIAPELEFRGDAGAGRGDGAHAVGLLRGGGAALHLYTARGAVRVSAR